jgi:hypothetical protein
MPIFNEFHINGELLGKVLKSKLIDSFDLDHENKIRLNIRVKSTYAPVDIVPFDKWINFIKN